MKFSAFLGVPLFGQRVNEKEFFGEKAQPLVVDCSVDKIDISVDRNLLLEDFSDLRIRIDGFWESSYCQSWESSTHNFYRASLGSCGFNRQTNDTHVTYSNLLKVNLMEQDPKRIVMYSGKNYVFPIECSYNTNLRTGFNFDVEDQSASMIQFPSISGEGVFRTAMVLYQDGTFTNPLPSEVTVNTNEILNVGVFLVDAEEGDNYRKLKINNCWASPTNSSQDPIQFDLIQDGCADNEVVKIMENGESSQARFTSEVFGFAGYQRVYLFCDISICFENCIKSCLESQNRRKRRAAINDDNQVLSLGPIVINEVENHKLPTSPERKIAVLKMVSLSGGLLCLGLLICGIGIGRNLEIKDSIIQ
ncbi:Oidioi.mRNA.OKI2018_I69.chr2.g4997.t1.cds [Oikopleura dioica]|uniref:Oidioi.mRNA.OKI2018_I69.chr2.g4997.t1.cds n=1 Tax=Oikopleura dioica TaxID=34765 RepID=A0ABN7T3D8_OIKDI|nr:Oidioi.mRNA.OKI2018_I69.chr2.g4997.t1.cds [Oikopleura dioica]